MRIPLHRLLRLAFGVLVASSLPWFASPAHAQGIWTGATNGSWNTNTNWSGGILPANGNTGTATMNLGGTTAVLQDSGGVWTLNSMVLNGSFTFSLNELLFDGTTPSLTATAGTTQFNNPVSYNQPLTIGGAGNITVTSVFFNGAGLTKVGAGGVAITPTNLVLGPVNVQGGTLTTSQTPVDATRTLNIAGGATVNTGPAYWAGLTGAGTLNLTGNAEFGGASTNVFTGNIGGGASYTHSGVLQRLLGNNGFTGGLTLTGGQLEIGDGVTGTFPSGPVDNSGTLVVNVPGAGTITSLTATGDTNFLKGTITGTSAWNLTSGNITIDQASLITTSVATPGQVIMTNAAGSWTVASANIGSLAGSGGNVVIGTLLTTGFDDFTTTFGGTISGAGALTKTGLGSFTLTSLAPHTYAGPTIVDSGLLSIGSVVGPVTVNLGATYVGFGTISGPLNVTPGASLVLHPTQQLLSTGNLTLDNSTVYGDINGTTAGVNYNQLRVTGTVTLNAPTLVLSGSYTPAVGDTFTLISNDGADPVVGTFSGLAEGALLNVNGRTMRISYVGGDGNDVVLSVLTYTVTPSAGIGGTITPNTPQSVAQGGTATFTVTPSVGYTASVGGTCTGSLVGTTYTTNPVNANCTVVASFTLNTYTVTPSAGANGTITPNTPQTIGYGSPAVFTVTPSPTYSASVGGTCGGNLVGNTYTTNPIVGNCTVIASFAQNTFTVTPSAGANGTIAPNTPQTVVQGATTSFTVTPNTGYAASVGGTCNGTLVGTTYTTNPVNANCTVVATFTLKTYTVTPSGGANGMITPSTPQTVAYGSSASFIVAPFPNYSASVGGTCGGTLVGNAYTTNPIVGDCTVAATFALTAITTFSGPTATGSGTATATFTGGGAMCTYTSSRFIPLTGDPASPPAGSAPSVTFPHGLFTFALHICIPISVTVGNVITMTITYPAALPPGTQYWKYGPTPGNAAPHWYVLPATITGNTVTFSITDGGLGDDDLAIDGAIIDQGGPGVPIGGAGGGAGTPIQTPTLSEWMLLLLGLLVLTAGVARASRKIR